MTKSTFFLLTAVVVTVVFTIQVIRSPDGRQGQSPQTRNATPHAVPARTPPAPRATKSRRLCDTNAARASQPVANSIEGSDEHMTKALDDLYEQIKRAKAPRSPGARQQAIAAITASSRRIRALEDGVLESFAQVEYELQSLQLPEILLARHEEAVSTFREKLSRLKPLLADLEEQGGDDWAQARTVSDIAEIFEGERQGPVHRPLDPAALPSRPPDKMPAREPAKSTEGLALLVSDELPVLASVTGAAGPLDPQPEDLAPTVDAQLTPAVEALASQLNHSPVEIFNWVRNNIEFIPTYGSVQGSEVTLLNRAGNSFDTSSLLVALYRAAGIPARYVYGTIEVPIDKALNWVGGAKRPEALQQVLGQGGIPNVAVVSGGTVRSIRVEHVWVEAFVDFEPSRGAHNRMPDTWVQVDPSFKQYELVDSLDFSGQFTVDAAEMVEQISASMKVGAHGAVTGLDAAPIETWGESAYEQLGWQLPEPRQADVEGERRTIIQERSVLSAALPNAVVARSGSFGALPSNLRHSLTLTLYASRLDEALDVSSLSRTLWLPEIVGKRLGVTYEPATDEDAAALADYRMADASTLPLYLLRVRPVLEVDGAEVARGPSVTMGAAQAWNVTLSDPSVGATHRRNYRQTAGDELVFGINGNGVTGELVTARFGHTPSNTAAENLHTISLYYWAQHDSINRALAASQEVLVQRLPSVGLFIAPLTVEYLFGIPRTGYYSQRLMDIGHSMFAATERANGDTSEFRRTTGLFGSLLEGRTFDTVLGHAEGSSVSAVERLYEANVQEIPIHEVTADNYDQVVPLLQLDAEVIADVHSAALQGLRALVPERAPTDGSWRGVGYIIDDPNTGAGAYLISGGLAGGAEVNCGEEPQTEPVQDNVDQPYVNLVVLLLMLAVMAYLLPVLVTAWTAGAVGYKMLILLGILAATSSAYPFPEHYPECTGPMAGDALSPPGDCVQDLHSHLAQEVSRLCKEQDGPRACRKFAGDCGKLREMRDKWRACAAARRHVMDRCFRGGGISHCHEQRRALDHVAACELCLKDCPD